MNRDFDLFVKEHLQEVFCEIEKNHASALLKRARLDQPKQFQLKLSRKKVVPEIQLQDCIISTSLSHNQL